jgi:YaiO family outer membrane protein
MEQVRPERPPADGGGVSLFRGARRGAIVVVATVSAAAGVSAQSPTLGDANGMIERATVLRRLNLKAKALAVMDTAAVVAPDRADVRDFRDLLRQEVQGVDATLGVNYTGWDDGRDAWREPQLAVRYGALGASYGVSGALYARTSVSAELFKTLPAAIEGSLGYRRLNFPSAVSIGTGSIGKYYSAYLFSARVNDVRGGATGTSALLSARRYFAEDGQFAGAFVTAGSVREDLRTAADLNASRSRSAGAEAQLVVTSRWLVNARGEVGRDQLRVGSASQFSSLNVGVGVRF